LETLQRDAEEQVAAEARSVEEVRASRRRGDRNRDLCKEPSLALGRGGRAGQAAPVGGSAGLADGD